MGRKKKLDINICCSTPLNDQHALFVKAVVSFKKTIEILRGPNGCPWDKEQSFLSLIPFMIEETYEAVDAAFKLSSGNKKSQADYCEELGDVLLQVFMNAELAHENNMFSIIDVINSINQKMIRRHPHVFAKDDFSAKNSEEVLKQWYEIKETEKPHDKTKTLLEKGINKKYLPTLQYGCAVSKAALNVGFSWEQLAQVFENLEKEVQELKHEIFSENPNVKAISDEAGDVIYSLCNLITFLKERHGMDKELCLELSARNSIEKFITRFKKMEFISKNKNKSLSKEVALSLTLDQWNELWEQTKLN